MDIFVDNKQSKCVGYLVDLSISTHKYIKMGIHYQICFDKNPDGTYLTGEIVKGYATIHLGKAIHTKGIQLRLRGYAEVRWDECVTNSDEVSTTTFDTHTDEEIYLDTAIECIETKESGYILEPGMHTYNFECLLPQKSPSSFEGFYGRIRYEVLVVIIRPHWFNTSYSKAFNVLAVCDLNILPDIRIPTKIEIFKTFCCGPFKSKPLMLSMDISRTGYVPGEFINFNVSLINNTGTRIEKIQIAINLIAHYSVRHHENTKIEKIPIARNRYSGIEKSSLDIKDKIQVPPTPSTCEDLCRILKITYEVELTTQVKGSHTLPVISIPIFIGNIPLVDSLDINFRETLMSNLRNCTLSRQEFEGSFAPSSYEEVTFLDNERFILPLKSNNNSETLFEKYSPKYPFYNA